MMDPILAEIRRIREEIASQFDCDLDRMCDYWQRQQSESGRKVVSLPSRPPLIEFHDVRARHQAT